MQDINEIEDKMQKLKEKYKLSNQEHYRIYTLIKKYYLTNITPEDKPIAVIVGAQPGSGKGSLIGYSKNKFDDTSNVIIITTDDYKPFHPKASEIAKKYPTYYSAVVDVDSSMWTNEILNEAIENKYNFILEVTFKNDRIIKTLEKLKEKGYTIIIRSLAVSYIESLLSAFERYEKQVQVRSWGRFFNPLEYNYTYENIPNTLENIENSRCFDAIEIFRRGESIKYPQLIYRNCKKDYLQNFENDSFINKYESAKESILKYRNEDLKTVNEEMEERIIVLENSFKNRNASKEELEGLYVLKELFYNYKS
ncbi:MAG: zeta toxin family protein [Clostridia bacterium]|nr:zeta toxin family protein [Clostridia bacterium]MBP3800932.1 zeta toxin family protein [Clostridia bacterium]